MNAGTLIYVGPGRVRTTATLPIFTAPNAVPFAINGAICVNVGGAIVGHVSGMPFGPSGRIVVQTNQGMPIVGRVSGLGITAAGRLACSLTDAIHHYVRGIPVTVDGRVAIDMPKAELDAELNHEDYDDA